MANPSSLPLYEKYGYKHRYKRVMDILILTLLLLLLGYRVISISNYSLPWFVALTCESWFTISWVFTFTTQWNPAFVKTYPERLLQRYLTIYILSTILPIYQSSTNVLCGPNTWQMIQLEYQLIMFTLSHYFVKIFDFCFIERLYFLCG